MRAESGTSFPVIVKMESKVLGKTVDVHLWPDRARVENVTYTLEEMKGIISECVSQSKMKDIHESRKGMAYENQSLFGR